MVGEKGSVLLKLPLLLKVRHLLEASVSPPSAAPSVRPLLENISTNPITHCCCGNQQAHEQIHPLLFLPYWKLCLIGHNQNGSCAMWRASGFFTNPHAKTKCGLNCTLPAQSVHCVALLCSTQPQLAPCLIKLCALPSIPPFFQKGKTKQQCLHWNALQVAIWTSITEVSERINLMHEGCCLAGLHRNAHRRPSKSPQQREKPYDLKLLVGWGESD